MGIDGVFYDGVEEWEEECRNGKREYKGVVCERESERDRMKRVYSRGRGGEVLKRRWDYDWLSPWHFIYFLNCLFISFRSRELDPTRRW
jgi:hypothetical protein